MKLFKVSLYYGVAVVVANTAEEVVELCNNSEEHYICDRVKISDVKEIKGYTVEGEPAVVASYQE